MRTTLDLDDVVLAAARSLARSEGISLGAAVSTLARRGLSARDDTRIDVAHAPFPVLTGEGMVTPDLVAKHRDD